ncbi:uncharacterized protein LOC143238612 [Tachypleus tridentatus]|uniref:uncharacterized protein LOC143238612 n=1 Tax=Tachypleus tridentatus TaxID=6853 RepID=UPI003FD2598D
MLWLRLLLPATLVVHFVCLDTSTLTNLFSGILSAFRTPHNETDLEEIKSYYDSVAKDMLDSVLAAHHLTSGPERHKRSSNIVQNTVIDVHGVHRLQGIQPVLGTCSYPVYIHILKYFDKTYSLCLSSEKESRKASVTLGTLNTEHWLPILSWDAIDPVDAVSFIDNGYLYLLVADSKRADGTDLMVFKDGSLELDHTINSKYATAIALWQMGEDNSYHLAIANSKGGYSRSLKDETYTYQWLNTYFDKYSSFVTYDVKDLEPFEINTNFYMAVANYRVSEDNYDVDSEILKYDVNLRNWRSFQRIRTYGAMDFEYFYLGEQLEKEFFLVIANNHDAYSGYAKYEVNTVIYKFVRDKFIPFQCLRTMGATKVSTFMGIYGEFVMAISNMYDAVQLYQYDGWRFVLSPVQYTRESMVAGALSVSFTYIESLSSTTPEIVMAVSNPQLEGSFNIFVLTFAHENRIKEWRDQSMNWCNNLLHKVRSSNIDEIGRNVNDLFYIDQTEPIILDGDLTFEDDLTITGRLKTPQLEDLKTGITYDKSIFYELEKLHNRLTIVQQKLKNVHETLSKALRTSGDQIITGEYSFKDVNFICHETHNCYFHSVNVTMLNGQNFTNIGDKVIFTDQSQVIDSFLKFQNMRVRDMKVDGKVDGMDTSTLVTRSGDHEILATKVIKAPLYTRDIFVNGLVNGMIITPENLLLTYGDQMITGDLEFVSLEVEALECGKNINGINLNEFYEDVVLVDTDHVIRGEKTIKSLGINGDLIMTKGALIDNVDIVDLWENALWLDGYQEIYAPYNFSSVVALNDLYAKTINGIQIPGPDVLLINEDAIITAPKHFEKTCSVSNLEVTDSLNGLRIIKDETSEWPNQLDIMVKSRAQTVFGKKTFNRIHLGAHAYVGRYTDGVDLSELAMTALDWHDSLPATFIINGDVEIKGPVQVRGLVDGGDLDYLYNEALRLDTREMPNFSSFVFKEKVQVENLQSPDINGIDFSKDVVLKHKNQVINGHKTFEKLVLYGNSRVDGLLNDLDLKFLVQDTLFTYGDQTMSGHVVIEGDLVVHALEVSGRLNNIDLKDVVLLYEDSVITSQKTFSNIVVEDVLQVTSMTVDGLIDGIRLEELMEDTMTYEDHQIVTGLKTAVGDVIIIEGSNLQTDNFSGVDLSEIWRDAVLIDEPQTITADKVFLNTVEVNNLWFYGTLDGVSDWDMKNNWMLQDADQMVNADLYFTKDVYVKSNVYVHGYVNDMDIFRLNKSIVKVDEPAFILGHITFENTVIAESDITVLGTVQNIDLSEEAVLTNRYNEISGPKLFRNGFVVNGDLWSEGLIDNVWIPELCSKTVLTHTDQEITGTTTVVGDVVIQSNLEVDGLINNVDIVYLDQNCWKVDEDVYITEPKSFEKLTIEGPVHLEGTLGNIDVVELNQTYMSISIPQEIPAHIILESMEVKGSLWVRNIYTANEEINGVNIRILNETVLKTIGDQVVTATYEFESDLIFTGDIRVSGTVDGINVPSDLMLRNRTNYISVPKVFQSNVIVLGDMDVSDGVTVQNVDVSEWAANSVYKTGHFDIYGKKEFSLIKAPAVWAKQFVDGIKVSKDSLLLTEGDQIISGAVSITGDVRAECDIEVDGLVNGIDLVDFSTRVMLKGRNNTITGKKTFLAPLTVNSIVALGDIDGVSLAELNEKIIEVKDTSSLQQELEIQGERIAIMEEAFANQAICLTYYELVHGFKILNSYAWGFVELPDNTDLLLLSDKTEGNGNGCSNIYSYHMTGKEPHFEEKEIYPAAFATDIISFTFQGNLYFVTSNYNPSRSCVRLTAGSSIDVPSDMSVAQIFQWTTETSFRPFQTLALYPSSSVNYFEYNDVGCIVFLVYVIPGQQKNAESEVFCAVNAKEGFKHSDTLHTRSPKQASIILHLNRTILAVANAFDVELQSFENSVDIYFWDPKRMKFGNPVQKITTTYARSVLLLTHNTEYSNECFLVIAEGRRPMLEYIPFVTVYRYSSNEKYPFYDVQKIPETGAIDLDWTVLPSGDLILFVLTDEGDNVKIYRFMGVSGFVKEKEFRSEGSRTLKVFTRRLDKSEEGNHYVALAGNSGADAYEELEFRPALLLRSKIKGRRLL